MKSQVNALLHVMQGLIKDVLAAYPALRSVNLDYERIALYCQTRGLSTFTLDLPNLDAILLNGLEEGRLRLSGPFSRRVSRAVRVPRLFSGLWLRVFDRSACLRQDVDVNAIFFLRQLSCLGKKLEVECSPERVNVALEKYHDIEGSLREPSLHWELDDLFIGSTSSSSLDLRDCCCSPDSFDASEDESLSKKNEAEGIRRTLWKVQQVADLLIGSWDEFDPISFSSEREEQGLGIGFRHGKGAVFERRKNWEKSEFPSWPNKLERVFPYRLCGRTAGSDLVHPSLIEGHSRLACVPKTAKGPRLIASEPTSHMWCQQAIMAYMVEQVGASFAGAFLNFHKQSLSGDLVLQASLDRKLATVDLSDASDRLTCWTVERIFRVNPTLLAALHAARTRSILDEISNRKGLLKPRKFASQGTATTFPVQSVVFLCIALACSLGEEISITEIQKLRNRVRVFGDDIILPSYGYARLVRVMEALQLKVNVAKSYVRGQFRESCGTDGYMGDDVTPVKPKVIVADGPASCQAVVDTINNLFSKGLWNASDSLRTLLPPRLQRGLRIVGVNGAGFAGLTSFVGGDERHLGTRWNPRLHRYEVRVWKLSSQTQSRDRQGWSPLLDFVSNKHNHEHARIVSEYGATRKAKAGFLWEPRNHDALGDDFTGTLHRKWPFRLLERNGREFRLVQPVFTGRVRTGWVAHSAHQRR